MANTVWVMYRATDFLRTIISSIFRIHVEDDGQDVPKNSICTKDETRSTR